MKIIRFSVMLILLGLAAPVVPAFAHGVSAAQTTRKKKVKKNTNLSGREYIKPHTRKGKRVGGYFRKAKKGKPGNRF